MGYVLRELNWRTDREAVLEFQRDTYELNFPGFVATDEFLAAYERDLRQAQRSRHQAVWVVEQEGRLCGFLWLSLIATMTDPCVGFINNLYVAPEERGKGLGRLLVRQADEWFRQQGVGKAQLTASAHNEAAIRLYESVGYRTIRVRMEKRCE